MEKYFKILNQVKEELKTSGDIHGISDIQVVIEAIEEITGKFTVKKYSVNYSEIMSVNEAKQILQDNLQKIQQDTSLNIRLAIEIVLGELERKGVGEVDVCNGS